MPFIGSAELDRLCMMLLAQESIRDVILFPQLKPK
jgi:lysyl-tRNA synthetase class II